MKTTIYDIAKEAGVSAMTVSRVMNRKNSTIAISKTTEEKVQKIAKKLNYTPDFMARALRKGRSYLIGVLVPNVTFSYLPEALEGIETVLRKEQSSVVLCTSEMNVEKEIKYLQELYAKKVDGLIIWPSGTEEQIGKYLQPFIRNNKAVVFIYRKLILPGTTSITVDVYDGAYAATKYLIEKGHRRIACRKLHCPLKEISPVISGYCKALEDSGIEFAPELQKPMDTYEQTYQSVCELINMNNPPTAVYTTGDYQAFGAINAARDSGLRVPEDFAIVGNNDIEFAAMSNPPLTTVAIPKREVGELAGKMVFDVINGTEIRDHKLSPRLVVRKSS